MKQITKYWQYQNEDDYAGEILPGAGLLQTETSVPPTHNVVFET